MSIPCICHASVLKGQKKDGFERIKNCLLCSCASQGTHWITMITHGAEPEIRPLMMAMTDHSKLACLQVRPSHTAILPYSTVALTYECLYALRLGLLSFFSTLKPETPHTHVFTSHMVGMSTATSDLQQVSRPLHTPSSKEKYRYLTTQYELPCGLR
jgi:hypothetical protein